MVDAIVVLTYWCWKMKIPLSNTNTCKQEWMMCALFACVMCPRVLTLPGCEMQRKKTIIWQNNSWRLVFSWGHVVGFMLEQQLVTMLCSVSFAFLGSQCCALWLLGPELCQFHKLTMTNNLLDVRSWVCSSQEWMEPECWRGSANGCYWRSQVSFSGCVCVLEKSNIEKQILNVFIGINKFILIKKIIFFLH